MRGWLGLGVVALLMCAVGAPAQAATTPPTLTVEVIGQGTVTGTGINCGSGKLSCYSAYGKDSTLVTLTATPASGWAFDHWEDSCTSSTSTTCPVTASGDLTATAIFTYAGAAQTATVGVALTPEGSGTSPTAHGAVKTNSASYPITCAQGAAPATTCSLTALAGSTITVVEAPDTGYFFNGWGGACAGTATSCSVYLTANQSVSADFVGNTSTNTLTVTASGSGSVSGGGISCGAGSTCNAPESPNSSVTLTASAQSGYVLTGWSGDCNGIQSTCTVQMNAARTVTATFGQLVPLAVTVTGSGSVTGGGIGCDGTTLGQTCTAGEAPNTTVVLTANPGSGSSVFWAGCTSSAGNFCTLTVGTAALAVTADFSGGAPSPIATNSLAVGVTGDGYVSSSIDVGIYCTAAGGSSCTANVQAGTTLTLTAIPASGTTGNFSGWTGDCAAFVSTTCTLTMSTSKSVEATFAGGNTTYVLGSQVKGSGTITGAGLNCTGSGSGCTASQAAGAAVTLTATPGFGAAFSGWSGACSGTSTVCTVSMTTAKSVTATFSGGGGGGGGGAFVGLTVAVTGAGTVTAEGITCKGAAGKTRTCEGSYATGKKVTLAAKPAAGYVLSAWTGGCSGAKPTCALTLASTKSVGAKFIRAVLTATHTPTVVTTKAGRRVTLWFHAGVAGVAQVVAERAGKLVLRHRVKVEPGGRHVLVTVQARGRYVLTLTLAKHTLRWRVTV